MRRSVFMVCAVLLVVFARTPVRADTEGTAPKKSAVDRLFEWAKKPWVDLNLGKGQAGDADSDSNESDADRGLGSGLSGTGGENTANPAKQVEFDDDRKAKAGEDHDHDHDHDHEGEGPKGQIGGPGSGVGGAAGTSSGGSRPLGYWYPMCLFMDAYISEETGNQTVKGIVDQAAKCDVNIIVFPITVRPGSYAMQPDAINDAQTRACNIVGKIPGAERASTSACVDHDQMADMMCEQREADPTPGSKGWKYKRETAGCAQLQSGGGEDIEKLLAEAGYDKNSKDSQKVQEYHDRKNDIEKHMQGGKAKSGQAAPSIEDKGQCSSGVVSHEALGHSQFGHPNGKGDGFGIGIHKDETMTEGWDPPGCAAMRKNAFPNTDKKWKYDPGRQKYYTKVKKPEQQYDLTNGKPLFNRRKNPPPAGPSVPDPDIATGGQGSPRVVTEDGGALPPNSPNPPATVGTSPGGKAIKMEDPHDFERHRQKPGDMADSLVKSVRSPQGEPESDNEIPDPAARPTPPDRNPIQTNGPRVGFSDAPKAKGGGGTMSNGSSGSASAVGPRTRSGASTPAYDSGEVYEDGSGSTSFGVSAPPSSAPVTNTGGSVGFNDNAPKAQLNSNTPSRESGPSRTEFGSPEEVPGRSQVEIGQGSGFSSGSSLELSTDLPDDPFAREPAERRDRARQQNKKSKRRTTGDNTPRRGQ